MTLYLQWLFCGERNGNCIWKYSSQATIRYFMPSFSKLKVMTKIWVNLTCHCHVLQLSSKKKWWKISAIYFTLEDDAIHNGSMRKIEKQIRRKWTIIRVDPLCTSNPFCPTPLHSAATLLKKRPWHKVFSREFCKIFK